MAIIIGRRRTQEEENEKPPANSAQWETPFIAAVTSHNPR